MNKELDFLKRLDESLMKTNSSNEKKQILSEYYNEDSETFNKMFEYIYSFKKSYYVTSKNCNKKSDLLDASYLNNDIYVLLDSLDNRTFTGYDAISKVNSFASRLNDSEKEIFWRVIDRNLKNGVSVSTVNKISNCVPEFKCALANKYRDYKDKINFEKTTWYVSQKLDGCRTITFTTSGQSYSREGNMFETLGKYKEELSRLSIPYGLVLDGETCIVDKDGREDFQKIIKEITRKDYTIPNPKYKIFDILTEEEFKNGYSNVPYSERMNRLNFESEIFEKLEVKKCNSEIFENMKKEANEKNWEGLMLRTDIYQGKRSNDLIKYKEFSDEEFEVIDMEVGPFQVISKETGLAETIETMTNVVIKLENGDTVSVGSGFSIDERKEFYNDRNKIVGHKITVRYFERTVDQFGKTSLRFPVFKGIRDVMI